MTGQWSSQFLILLAGATAMLAGHLARRQFQELRGRMMCPLTVVGRGARWAKKPRSWLATVSWALITCGVILCVTGVINACSAGQ